MTQVPCQNHSGRSRAPDIDWSWEDDPEGGGFSDMDWPKLDYSRGAVRRAGDLLRDTEPSDLFYPVGWDDNLKIINNWRSFHSFPLQILKMTLLKRSTSVARPGRHLPIVAQRLKRLESIWTKLRLNPHMSLTQMQDIGGCRAVMRSAAQVGRLVEMYEAAILRESPTGPNVVERYDYISNPKPSGYRSFHYVYKYGSRSDEKKCYNGLRIEIQIRSQLQHAWATAVETVSTLTSQALKSNLGSDDWKRFFALSGSALAIRERKPMVPGTPTNKKELFEELKHLDSSLKVGDVLPGYGTAIYSLIGQEKDAAAYLLVLDPTARQVDVHAFSAKELNAAEDEYLRREKELDKDKGMQAVLVSARSIRSLKRAYPNYFLDTTAFFDALRAVTTRG